MKKIVFLLLCFCLCGCSKISEEEYNLKVSELQSVSSEYEQYKIQKEKEISELNEKYLDDKNKLNDKISALTEEKDLLSGKIIELEADKEYANNRIDSLTEKNDKLREEVQSYQNVNLDTMNIFFEDDKIIADEIELDGEKWLLLTDTKYDLYDLILGNVDYDTDTLAMKMVALSKEDWFDYSKIVLNLTIKQFGIIGSFEIDPVTFEMRQGIWSEE